MEKLVDSGLLAAVIDLTTTEVCDLLMGGVLPATEDRFGAMIRARMPYVGSVGALDMVNFGPPDTVPPAYTGRRLHVHNPQVTLDAHHRRENGAIGRWIGEKLNQMDGPVRFFLPEGGVSALDAPGQAFHDPEADAALFRALEQTVRQTASRQLIRVKRHINDPEFRRRSSPPSGRCIGRAARASARRGDDDAHSTRSGLMEKFRAMAARGEPIVGGGAGTGLSAKCEEAGGVDLIVIYNSGRYRMAGPRLARRPDGLWRRQRHRRRNGARGAARGQAHAGAGRRQRHRPVPPDGCVPRRDRRRSASAGVQNFPTVGLIDGTFRANLEETGMCYGLEVDMIAAARAKDLLTTPYVFNEGEAEAMARAGADIIVCHLGLTTGGAIGAQTALKLDDCPALIDAWAGAALRCGRTCSCWRMAARSPSPPTPISS